GDSLIGRLGFSADYWSAQTAAASARSNVYGIANLYYEFLNGTKVDVAGTPFASHLGRLWGGVGVGGKYSWAEGRYSVFGEALVTTSLETFADSYAYTGTAGVRVMW